MENLLDNLKILLKKDERLVSEGELLKNKVIELAIKLDKDLIKLLLADKQMKEVFFTEAGKATIFDKDKFIKFVSNKQFLPDSYTAFKNKIGLTEDDEFISEKKEVVLAWPYKDCVLEGGMTKEDQKRDEIFWNETLAPDEISRLLDPKVFTNAKRIDKKGEHKLDEFRTDENGDIKDNLIIKGNNLLALHSLKKRFAGKVKLIYIDPPYNTGGAEETFTYNNSFIHSTWLTFMKNRLEVAKSFLRKDGFIAITIDHNELFYLGVLADEIFGEENRIGLITIVHKPEGRQHSKFFSPSNEFMLVYAVDKQVAKFNNVVLSEEKRAEFSEEDDKGRFKWKNFIRGDVTKDEKTKGFYPIYVSSDLASFSLEPVKDYEKVLPIDNAGNERAWIVLPDGFTERFKNGEIKAERNRKRRIEIFYKIRESQVFTTHWIDKKYNATAHGTNLVSRIVGGKTVSYPKSLYSVLDTLKIMTNDEDVILDFFAGSGTTGHATLKLNKEDGGNRKFILVEQLDEHVKVSKKRIGEILNDSDTGNNFVYLELMNWNENFVEKIRKAKTKDELKKLWEKMKEKTFLSYKVDIKTIDENAKDFIDLPIEDQKRFLLECLDKNHLYINYSEIHDEEYGVSKEDKRINREFYS